MGLYSYFIKRWLIKEAKINLDWYSLDFSVETLQYEPTIICILICFSINLMPPQSHWPFSQFTRQIPGCLVTISPSFSTMMVQGSSRKKVRSHPGVGQGLPTIGGATEQGLGRWILPLLSCVCTSLSQQKCAGAILRGPIPAGTELPLAWMEANPNQTCFTRADECSVHWEPHVWVCISSELPSHALLFSLCT